jgi:proteasome lid subunit RPN8/RPN11
VPSIAIGSVVVKQSVLDDIARHAREESPNECCGLLVGALPRIDGSVRARNLRAWRSRRALRIVRGLGRAIGAGAPPLRYLIDPRDHFAALKLARSLDLAVVGAYHSHPCAPPIPSPTDLSDAIDTALVHVIVTPETADHPLAVRAWLIEQTRFHEVMIVTPGEPCAS